MIKQSLPDTGQHTLVERQRSRRFELSLQHHSFGIPRGRAGGGGGAKGLLADRVTGLDGTTSAPAVFGLESNAG